MAQLQGKYSCTAVLRLTGRVFCHQPAQTGKRCGKGKKNRADKNGGGNGRLLQNLQRLRKIGQERIGADYQKEADNKEAAEQPFAPKSQTIKGNCKKISKLQKE